MDKIETEVANGDSQQHELGWSIQLDHSFPRSGQPLFLPRFKQMLPLIAQAPNFAKFWIKKRLANQRVPMDHANLVPYRPIYGVPIGGVGSGTIGRAYGGAFCRFQMVPGHYSYCPVEADQFILRVVRSSQSQSPKPWQQALCVTGKGSSKKPTVLPQWKRLDSPESVSYRALYPRSWTTYNLSNQCGVEAVCRQISPIIPGDYTESCLPCAVFVWDLKNTTSEEVDISLAFTFKNGVGEGRFDKKGGCYTEGCMLKTEDGSRQIRCSKIFQELKQMSTTYCIGVLDGSEDNKVATSHRLSFNPLGSGGDLWEEFYDRGSFSSPLDERSKTTTQPGQEIGSAVAGSCYRVAPGQSRQIVFTLAWHQPSIHFNTTGHFYTRRYVRFCQDADALVSHALSAYKTWEVAIDSWQMPVLSDATLPEWFRSAIFNEMYYIADGGTVWVDVDLKEIDAEAISPTHRQLMIDYGRFAYLEGHEYRMYTTYDVHFNASFALVQLWPNIEMSIQYEFARTVPLADPRPSFFLMGASGDIKVPGCVPHDLGDPDSDPWLQINAYFVHPTDQWKDLNLKFILSTWRDFVFAKNKNIIHDLYPICSDLIKRCLAAWDLDGDGLIENGGAPDQTYDNWVMTGPSAYCGGLWLASLRACELMARELGQPADAEYFGDIRKKASEAYEKRLWNGKYYNFDCNRSESIRSTVMADQLAGYWYLRMCDLVQDSENGELGSQILPPDHVQSVLTSIVDNNFRAICGGQWGVVNGAKPDRRGVDKTSIQSEEIWIGINYCLASLLIASGRRSDGLAVAQAVYRGVYDSMGLGFQTPEAYNLQFKFRSLGYMRPLAIWSMMPSLKHAKLFEDTVSMFAKGYPLETVKMQEQHCNGTTEIGWWKVEGRLLLKRGNFHDPSIANELDEIGEHASNADEVLTAKELASYCRSRNLEPFSTTFSSHHSLNDFHRACYWLGLLMNQTDPKRQLDLLRKAVSLNPNDFWYRKVLADRLKESGDLGEALRQYWQAVELRYDCTSAHLGIAECVLKSNFDLKFAGELRHHLSLAEIFNPNLTLLWKKNFGEDKICDFLKLEDLAIQDRAKNAASGITTIAAIAFAAAASPKIIDLLAFDGSQMFTTLLGLFVIAITFAGIWKFVYKTALSCFADAWQWNHKSCVAAASKK